MMLKAFRRSSARYVLVSCILVSVLFYTLYYMSSGSGNNGINGPLTTKEIRASKLQHKEPNGVDITGIKEGTATPSGAIVPSAGPSFKTRSVQPEEQWEEEDHRVSPESCPRVQTAQTQVDAFQQFPKFDFQPSWMKGKEYWDSTFEDRYQKRKKTWPQLPLKVIVVPHSHNDPGWLKTYEGYFHSQTRQILNNMVEKLHQYPNMTFMFSEISFFSKWWESAHPTKRRVVRELLDSGRLEITTGGWVMTDEANVHIYAMLDQLIEGHQWVKSNLGVTPRTGWSVDPFGHGATVPYLLSEAGISNMVIQRIHYAWKQWLAQQQLGDFMWRQRWDAEGKHDILCHNAPYDIYSIKHSCGPHPQVCLAFDFRKVPGEYTEYTLEAVPITPRNLKAKAELLLEQYGRTGSLYPHNVVLVPLGDDFRYNHDLEWDQQYQNYKLLFDFINSNKHQYNAEIQFGTLEDYFKAIRERTDSFPTLQGDFFVYSDIFTEGRPAYWSGYFSTRPYWKALDRELEAGLRSAEILYTVALNRARQQGLNRTVQVLERDYEKLVKARQSLALFQHHDAITGTSKAFVMQDYGVKLFEALQDMISVQGRAAQALLADDLALPPPPNGRARPGQTQGQAFLLPDTDREAYDRLARKIPLIVRAGEPRRIVLFNSLAQQRQELIKVVVHTQHIRVADVDGNAVVFQINPVWNLTSDGLTIIPDVYEIAFIAELPPLSLSTYVLKRTPPNPNGIGEDRAVIYCAKCGTASQGRVPSFDVRPLQAGDIQLENHRMKLLFDGRSGFLQSVTRKATGKTTQIGIQFAAYPSAQFHSGAYLFMPDPNSRTLEKEILVEGSQQVFIVSGPVMSELSVLYDRLLLHTVRLFHNEGPLADALAIENLLDMELPPKHRETEIFMRFVSDIHNEDPPRFYTDQSGFQMQPRVKVERIGIEGNYFPITTSAYIEDNTRRLTLIVKHAHGASSWQTGWLEVMLDRRTLYDDSRGLGEGVVDNKRNLAKYWLLLEENNGEGADALKSGQLSLLATSISNSHNYPTNLFVVDGVEGRHLRPQVWLLNKPFPCDVHLLNLRTLSDQFYYQFPSSSALLVLHRQGYSCSVPSEVRHCSPENNDGLHEGTRLKEVQMSSLARTSLTGLHAKQGLKSFDNILISPLELNTYNITFTL